MNSLGAFELEKRLRKVRVSLSANKVLKFVLQISKLFSELICNSYSFLANQMRDS